MNSRNYQGFTLLESVVALFVLLLMCHFFLLLVRTIKTIANPQPSQTEIEWQTFLIQTENETSQLNLMEVNPTKLVLKKTMVDGNIEWTRLEKYKNMIRKSTNNGHQPLLLHVNSVEFIEVRKKLVEVHVVFESGEDVVGRIWYE